MKCFKCAKGRMMPAVADMIARVRGEEIPVRTEAMVCNRCGFQVMTDVQSDAYTIASADAYRSRHGLLTTEELKQVRERLRMSFRTYAKYLKVSEASPKRWEAGLVQDQAMDELIRLKSDLVTARENVTRLETHLGVTSAASRTQVIVVQMPRREAESEWDAPGASHSTESVTGPSGFLTCMWPTA
jgi:putative zinc finger/helix-turn-helix YgiT family protein